MFYILPFFLLAAEPDTYSLIQQMGDPSYEVREEAYHKLKSNSDNYDVISLVRLSIDEESDPEIRRRCHLIYTDYMVIETDIIANYQKFNREIHRKIFGVYPDVMLLSDSIAIAQDMAGNPSIYSRRLGEVNRLTIQIIGLKLLEEGKPKDKVYEFLKTMEVIPEEPPQESPKMNK